MLGVLVVVFGPDHVAGLGLSLGQREIMLIASLRVLRAPQIRADSIRWHCFGRSVNRLADFGRCLPVIVFGPFCMAHSLIMAGEICRVRQGRNQ